MADFHVFKIVQMVPNRARKASHIMTSKSSMYMVRTDYFASLTLSFFNWKENDELRWLKLVHFPYNQLVVEWANKWANKRLAHFIPMSHFYTPYKLKLASNLL